jgi:hypothetical protein
MNVSCWQKSVVPFNTTMNFSEDIELTISNLRKQYVAKNLKDKTGFLMISVKNKSFSNRLIEYYFNFAEKYLKEGFVTIVDTPYIHNINAIYSDEEERQHEIKKLKKIAEENQKRIARLLKKRHSTKIKSICWTKLEEQTPQWLYDEVIDAFKNKGSFYSEIIKRTREVLPQGTVNEENLIGFSQFLLMEIPVLCTQYYLRHGSIVDIYPGENPDFLWKLEAGHYSDELPLISEKAKQGSGLIYIDFRLIN